MAATKTTKKKPKGTVKGQLCPRCEQYKKADRQRWADDPRRWIANEVKGSLRAATKKGKDFPTLFGRLGYTRDELIAHLKGTLPAGCTWQDYLDGRMCIHLKKPWLHFEFASTTDPVLVEILALENLFLSPYTPR